MLQYQKRLREEQGLLPACPGRRPAVFSQEAPQSLSWGMEKLNALERTLSSESFGNMSDYSSQSSSSTGTGVDSTTSQNDGGLRDEDIVQEEMQRWISEHISDSEMKQLDLIEFWKVSHSFPSHVSKVN